MAGGTMVDSIEMARVFRRLFDAAADFEKWPQFLQSLAGLFDARGANLMYFDYSENRLAFTVQHGFEHVPLPVLERASELFAEDPRIEYARRHAGMPVTCRQSVEEKILHSSRVYKEFLQPAGVEYTLGVHFLQETMGSALSVMRGPDDPPFNQSDTDLLSEIIPSIKRAIELHKRLAMLDFEKRAALDAFNGIPMGMFLLDEGGRVLFANQMAQDISADNDGLKIVDDRLYAHRPDETKKINDFTGSAVSSARLGSMLPAEGLAITRISEDRPYELVMVTIWGNHLRYGLGKLDDPVIALFITDPERPQEVATELLQRLFGLTPAESFVVESLVNGKSVTETADKLGISVHTAREHLSVAFEKTGTKRQGELIKRVLSSPAWITVQKQHRKFPERSVLE